MLPVSIFLFDLCLIQGMTKDNLIKSGKILILPLLMIAILGLVYSGGFSNILEGYVKPRLYFGAKVATEPRVIFILSFPLLYPIGSRLTLLYDIEVSRFLFQPCTTLPAILIILIIIGFSSLYCEKATSGVFLHNFLFYQSSY